MKVLIMKTNLREGLSLVEKSVSENANLAILKNVLCVADDTGLTLTATNLEVAASCVIAGKVIEPGRVTIPAGVFSALVNNLPSERISLETHDDRLDIESENYQGQLVGLPADDYPLIPAIEKKDEWIEMEGALMKEAFSQVITAAQASDIRPELGSVLFHFSLNTIILVATDVFRLAEKTIQGNQFKHYYKEELRRLIPLKTIQEVLRITKDDERVMIFFDDNQVLFKTKTYEFISRLINGNFPDYGGIIPKEFNAEIVVNRQDFMRAVKLSGVLGGKNNEVCIAMAKAGKTIEVFSSDQVVGENTSIIIGKISGSFEKVTFNWRYLIDGLKALKNEDVFLGINKDNKPALLKDTKDSSYFYLLAPLLNS